MKDKEMIEEMAKDLKTCLPSNWYWLKTVDTDTYLVAKHFHNEGYRKVPEDSVVLTREEFEKYQNLKRDVEYSFEYNQGYTDGQIKGSKETAKKILKWLVETGVINTAPDTTKIYFKEEFGVEV